MDTLTSAKVGIIPESTKYIPVFFTKAGKTPCINDKMVHSVIPEGTCQSGSLSHRRSRLPEQEPPPSFWHLGICGLLSHLICYMYVTCLANM